MTMVASPSPASFKNSTWQFRSRGWQTRYSTAAMRGTSLGGGAWMNMPQYKAVRPLSAASGTAPTDLPPLIGAHSEDMANRRGRHVHEGGFCPCTRCGRRTFWLCGELRPASLPRVRHHRTSPPGHQRRPASHVPPVPARVPLPGPARRVRWAVDGALATDRNGRRSIAALRLDARVGQRARAMDAAGPPP
jgi:hypothetical protein